ncbi:hypothetical protein C8A00DRAFT_19033 [Chaetomidium leptoderma]|uniref:O-methyltransferase domain-containing protein n=1 Tax=Chaetomidium leptoderma TaxID=669021 RepID=A0AAN6VE76_9PEZI|nr:hypothetical protein C8A00DRAFT_19033 [Chaetomidium leptoderma]
MSAHRISNYGRPEPMEHTTKLAHTPGLDAIETLKVVQGLINTCLANVATDGRSAIPTPEPSPVPKFTEDGKPEVVGMDGGQAEAVREDADLTRITAVAETGEAKGEQTGINPPEAASGAPQIPQHTDDTAANRDNCDELNSKEVNASLNANNTEPDGPAACESSGDGRNTNKTKTAPPPAIPGLDQDRLQRLADEISRNISQMETDDSSRIKAATAALELAAAVRPPGDTIMGWFANMSVISAVRLFLHWGAFDIIPTEKGESITYTDLAERINADVGLVARVANMLTSSHILTHHHFTPPPSSSSSSSSSLSLSHTPTSLLLRSNQPMSAMFALLYTNITHVSTVLPSYFDTYGRAEPLGPGHIPTSYLAGAPEADYFALLRRDERALRGFGLAMRMASRRVPVTGVYDMARVLRLIGGRLKRERDVVWVDVGGGDGHTVGEFLERYAGIPGGLRAEQCVVQDLEEVVVAARGRQKQREEGDDGGLLLKGVRWVGMDFLKEAPVKG